MSPAMSWRSFLLGACAIAFIITVDAKPITGNETSEITPSSKTSSVFPPYLSKYGILGVNYGFDTDKKQPYIICQKYRETDCAGKNRTDCVREVKCYPNKRTEQLACMAVMSYSNIPNSPPKPYMQDCWNQGSQNGDECPKDASCSNRRLQSNSTGTLFCCCKSHMCNAVASDDAITTKEPTTPKPMMTRPPASRTGGTVIPDEDILIAVCVVAFLLLVCLFSCVYSYCKREYYTIKVDWHDNWVEYDYDTVNSNPDEQLPRIILTT
uniref:Activin_recp domain-containing protein n=1 Tax=Panagrellus redivivus TaxID=6233 RepID=A0A7E4VI03_PANRE